MNIQFHLTNACNLRCKHCYQGEYNPATISLSDFKNILEKTKIFFNSINDSINLLMLTGGDPMCVPNIENYILSADSYCKEMGLMTNGLLLTPAKLEEFKKAKHFRKIQVSLEGPEKINDSIRGIGTYKKIRTAIKYINDAGLRSTVSCTIASYNYNKIKELYDDLVLYDAPQLLWFDRCIPFKGTEVLTKEQFKVFIDMLREIRVRWENEKLVTCPAAIRALQWMAKDEPCEHYVCGAGFHHFTIMYNGDVMLCRRLDFPVGNLFKEDWSSIISRSVPIMKKMHTVPDECQKCDYAKSCYGGLRCLTYALYKDFNHKDVNCYLGEK